MTLSNQNLNENNAIERRNNLPTNENLTNNNIINYNNSNQVNSVNARENSEVSNLYFNIFSEVNQNNLDMNNDNELAGRNFDNELDDVFQNLTYLDFRFRF